MAIFDYHATNAQGAEVTGRIDAADASAARARLAQDGLQPLVIRPVASEELADGPTTISNADAMELTTQLADLVSADLPLASGLKALASDMPSSRLATAIQRLSAHLESGTPLDAAVNMPDVRLPAYLRGLLACGLRSGKLGEVLEQFLGHQRMREDLNRRLWSALAYPAIVIMVLLGWILFVFEFLVRDFQIIFEESHIDLPGITVSLLKIANYGMAIVIVLVCLVGGLLVLSRWFGRNATVSRLLTLVPLIGPLWRDRGLAEFSSLLGLLVKHGLTLPTALELTSTGLDDGALAAACRESRKLAEDGFKLTACVTRVQAFSRILVPIVGWGDRMSALPEALDSASEIFWNRCKLRSQFIAIVVPPLTFLVVTATALFVIVGLFIPLTKLIHSLT